VNGILLVNKPKGITSHDVVYHVRKVMDTKAVGHAGTLDPMAEGLLIVLLGEATKFSNQIMGQNKVYVAELCLGLKTESWDLDSPLMEEFYLKNKINFDLNFEKEFLEQKVSNLVGDLQLSVPIYSAVKIKGKKLYDYARDGDTIVTPTRTMRFYKSQFLSSEIVDLKLEGVSFSTLKIKVYLECEKGAYIRSWVHHLGEILGIGAVMTSLVRVQSGEFKLQNALDFGSFDQKNYLVQGRLDIETKLNSQAQVKSKLIDLKNTFNGPFFRASETEIKMLKNGLIPHDLSLRFRPQVLKCQAQDKPEYIRIFDRELSHLVAVIELDPNKKPKIIRALQN
jgi:tRNA pseudouridine55 synthase